MKREQVSALDVQRVFVAWRETRPRPALCKATADRLKVIADRMALGYSAGDLIALVRYVTEGDDHWCHFMRANEYTGLDYLLRKDKLGDRVERALLWLDGAEAESAQRAHLERTGVDLGPLGALRRTPEA